MFDGLDSLYKGKILSHDKVKTSEEAFYFIFNNLLYNLYSDMSRTHAGSKLSK